MRGIILLGSLLGKSIIAEGIETPEQFELLQEMGCKTGQGFHLSRPLRSQSVDALLEAFVGHSKHGLTPRAYDHVAILH